LDSKYVVLPQQHAEVIKPKSIRLREGIASNSVDRTLEIPSGNNCIETALRAAA
jgi:hypothetical protein